MQQNNICQNDTKQKLISKIFFGTNLFNLVCKLYLFIALRQLLLALIEWSSLQKVWVN
jgi:hypothetical protein